MNITKSAPLPERPCEQLTCCEKIGSVQRDYITRAEKRHNCRITGKTKATAEGRQWESTKLERIANNARFAAGGQCDQCAGLLVGYSCSLLPFRCATWKMYGHRFTGLWDLRNCSSRNIFIFFHSVICVTSCAKRFFRLGMIYPLLAVLRHSASHYGAGNDDYSSSLFLWNLNLGRLLFLMKSSRRKCSWDAGGVLLTAGWLCLPHILWRFSKKNVSMLSFFASIVFSSGIAMRRSTSHHGADSFYSLDSMPRCCNSLRIIRFIQAARESSPSCCCAFSIFSRKSGSKRNWNGGLPRLSFLCVDTSITPHVMYLYVMTRYTQSTQKAKPCKCRYHWQGL